MATNRFPVICLECGKKTTHHEERYETLHGRTAITACSLTALQAGASMTRDWTLVTCAACRYEAADRARND